MKKKILIADDDTAIVDALQIMLEGEGYIVKTAQESEIFKTVISEKPDLLLLDVWMAGLDGREICKQLKSDPKTQNLQVILLSANKDLSKIANESGADSYIEKPFEMDQMLEKISYFVNKSS